MRQRVAVGIDPADVEQVDAAEDDEEAGEEGYGVDGVRGVEAAEEDEGCEQGEGREGDVVERVDEGGVKLVEGLVEIVHLREDADDDDDGKDVGARVCQLIVAGKGELEGDAEALDAHDGDGSDSATDRDVDERIPLAVSRGDLVDHGDREYGDGETVDEEAGLQGVVQDLVDRLHVLVGGGMQDDDDRPEETERTAQLAQDTELLLQEDRGEDGADEDRQRAEGSDEDGGSEGIGRKVGYLADDHRDHARPPYRVLEVPELVGIVALASLRVDEALLRDDERRADRERRGYRETEADIFRVYA